MNLKLLKAGSNTWKRDSLHGAIVEWMIDTNQTLPAHIEGIIEDLVVIDAEKGIITMELAEFEANVLNNFINLLLC